VRCRLRERAPNDDAAFTDAGNAIVADGFGIMIYANGNRPTPLLRARKRSKMLGSQLHSGDARARLIATCALLVWIVAFLALRGWMVGHGATPLRWDVGWYVDIATRGYTFNGNISVGQNVAFLPAWPSLLNVLMRLGLAGPGAVLVLSLACAIGGSSLLFRALCAATTPATSAVACALAIASPFSMYFLNGYSESLYFLSMSAFWWALFARRDTALAALFAGLAGLVRPYGVVLAVVWAIEVARREHLAGTPPARIVARLAALGPLAIAGPLIVCLYHAHQFGDLFLYRNILGAWGADIVSSGWADFVNHLRVESRSLAVFHPSLVIAFPTEAARLLFWMGLAVTVAAARRAPPGITLYGLGLIAFCVGSTEGAANLGRHLATNIALPLGIVLLLSPHWTAQARQADHLRYGLLAAAFCLSLAAQMLFLSWFYQGRWVS
jgi:hypothetical protein